MHHVAIRNNETGEVLLCEQNVEWNDNSLFWWLEGNMSCDCNRELEWAYAKGEPIDFDDAKCSDGRFTALYALLEDGTKINLEDE